jgi:hypothetical protein
MLIIALARLEGLQAESGTDCHKFQSGEEDSASALEFSGFPGDPRATPGRADGR